MLCPRRRSGRLSQCAAHVDLPFSGMPRQLCARRLVVPWTDTGPRGKGASGREGRHIGANFRHQRFTHLGANPWGSLEEINGLGQKRIGALVKLALNFRGRAGNRPSN